MPDLTFARDGRAHFPTKYHGMLSMSKAKWDEVCQEPERFYYRQNGEKVATTLIHPDFVRCSKSHRSQFLYYKQFEIFQLSGKGIAARLKYWTVIIDTRTMRICTVYPTNNPKPGKEYKPGVRHEG